MQMPSRQQTSKQAGQIHLGIRRVVLAETVLQAWVSSELHQLMTSCNGLSLSTMTRLPKERLLKWSRCWELFVHLAQVSESASQEAAGRRLSETMMRYNIDVRCHWWFCLCWIVCILCTVLTIWSAINALLIPPVCWSVIWIDVTFSYHHFMKSLFTRAFSYQGSMKSGRRQRLVFKLATNFFTWVFQFLPLDKAIASRAVFVIVFGSGGRTETLLGPAK